MPTEHLASCRLPTGHGSLALHVFGRPDGTEEVVAAVAALRWLRVDRIRLATNNPVKIAAFARAGIAVTRLPLGGFVTPDNGGGAAAEALLGLGRAPAGATSAAYRARGLATVPRTGILSVTTPGLLDAWFAVHERHGTLPLGRLLAPAVVAARDGIAVSGQLARWGTETVDVLRQPGFVELYRPYAGTAAVGTVLRQPGLARSTSWPARPARTPPRSARSSAPWAG